MYNLGFGDLLPDGKIDDTVNSNNGDIIKVLSTIVHIVKDFVQSHPNIKIVFTGSTSERLKLYERILRTYYEEFITEFVITCLVKEQCQYREVKYDPKEKIEYLAFFICRIV